MKRPMTSVQILFIKSTICQEKQLSSCEWMQEGYSLSWDGNQALILRNSSVLAAVYEGQVNLEPSIQEYNHVPYSWLLSIKETLSDKS